MVVRKCPSCREIIPSSTLSNDNVKLSIQINMALKALLDTLHGSEMNQRRLAEEQQKHKAQGGELGEFHTC